MPTLSVRDLAAIIRSRRRSTACGDTDCPFESTPGRSRLEYMCGSLVICLSCVSFAVSTSFLVGYLEQE